MILVASFSSSSGWDENSALFQGHPKPCAMRCAALSLLISKPLEMRRLDMCNSVHMLMAVKCDVGFWLTDALTFVALMLL